MQMYKNQVFENPASRENCFVKYSGKQNPEDLSAIKEQSKAAGGNKIIPLTEKVLSEAGPVLAQNLYRCPVDQELVTGIAVLRLVGGEN